MRSDRLTEAEREERERQRERSTVMWSQMLLISCVAVRAPRHNNHES